MPAPNFVRNDVVVKKGGVTTVRAVVTDEAGQVSSNTCQADIDVKGGFPIFAAGYFGKERLTHDDAGEIADALGASAPPRRPPSSRAARRSAAWRSASSR